MPWERQSLSSLLPHILEPDPSPCLTTFQHIFNIDKMPDNFSTGLICLIPKGGDQQEVRQWQPITLLPIAYKALAKMTSARV